MTFTKGRRKKRLHNYKSMLLSQHGKAKYNNSRNPFYTINKSTLSLVLYPKQHIKLLWWEGNTHGSYPGMPNSGTCSDPIQSINMAWGLLVRIWLITGRLLKEGHGSPKICGKSNLYSETVLNHHSHHCRRRRRRTAELEGPYGSLNPTPDKKIELLAPQLDTLITKHHGKYSAETNSWFLAASNT